MAPARQEALPVIHFNLFGILGFGLLDWYYFTFPTSCPYCAMQARATPYLIISSSNALVPTGCKLSTQLLWLAACCSSLAMQLLLALALLGSLYRPCAAPYASSCSETATQQQHKLKRPHNSFAHGLI